MGVRAGVRISPGVEVRVGGSVGSCAGLVAVAEGVAVAVSVISTRSVGLGVVGPRGVRVGVGVEVAGRIEAGTRAGLTKAAT